MINKLKELRETGSEEGFTLIELMIVVVIIGILAAIAIPIFMNQQKAAIVAGVKSDVKNTVTNVATWLVKKPTATATEIAAAVTAGDIAVLESDANTHVGVGGAWNTYYVVAVNGSVKGGTTVNAAPTPTVAAGSTATDVAATDVFTVLYNSQTGDTTVAND